MSSSFAKPALPHVPTRRALSLDGAWSFRHDSDGIWREARVPAPWQACFEDLAVSFGTATYRRSFSIPAGWSGSEIAVCFGAVGEICSVALNGTEIGRHEGGYLPFDIVLPPHLVRDENELQVIATLPDAARHGDTPDFAEIPHGKQSWYGPQAGIWQSVHLEARPALHISSLRLDPHWPDGRLDIRATLSQPVAAVLTLTVTDPAGALVATETVHATTGVAAHTLQIQTPAAWSPDAPNLYRAQLSLQPEGASPDAAADERVSTFGFRSFVARDGYLWLNDQPLYLRGALDQDYYPDGFGTPPSLEMLEDQLRKSKAMGLNCLRCHIKVPDPRYYDVADRLGMLIWTEIPNIETFSPAAARRLHETMAGILARDRNHPSIVIWTLINEDWGTRLRESAEQRRWISEMVDWLRAEDPMRLVVDNSACFPNYHVKTDINDYHFYRTATDRRDEWDLLCKEFAGNADWTFSTDDEAVQTGKEPLILSEFGVWGLPDPARLRGDDGRDPWWASYGATWADGTALPQGVEARYRELGLSQVFGPFPAFIEQVQWHQYMNLKYEIEVIRRHPEIGGYVVTELTDVHWEGNGLMDMARNPRVFATALPEVNGDVVIAPGTVTHAVASGGTARFELALSAGGSLVPAGSRLEWSLADQRGVVDVPEIRPMQVHEASLDIAVGPVATSLRAPVAFRLLAPNGAPLATNTETLSLYGEREITGSPAFATDREDVEQRLTGLGYGARGPQEAEVFVTDRLTPEMIERIHGGLHVLQIVSKAPGRLRDDTPPRDGPTTIEIDPGAGGLISGAYFTFPGYSLVDRHKSLWRGDWVGNFSWLRRDGPFSHVPGGPLLDLSFNDVVPHQVMTGFRPWEFHGRVHAGVVIGWVHKPAAFLIEKRLGRGKLVATTFRLLGSHLTDDPVSTALLDGLMRLTESP
ncbi:glycosyl hydrolase [Rhizobium sp. Leaf384]|uniref:glycoside hydrolase family 2 protein n=1 Tax=unclassified Rhizobium TaxID=2613769 RepID=UPI000713FED5|nr:MULTISPECIES: glycoside hydrolase family 2 [unclassified Rhizobium]KQS75199.1 glycosyl hydrolase [Rhizobium sp. Leaf384]KQS85524.1 glycosyl hydrolase [Rhizobium sp. Leaf383]